jgi:DNA-binding winged helix-turn-helix (wHTH) protein/TolB-like protein/Tfp pilus assembly protein PilF
MVQQIRRFYEFGEFRLDTSNRLLLRAGKVVPLKPKVVETLLVLVEHRGEVLAKDSLIKALWPDSFVEESNLTQNIYVLRKALGESTSAPVFIETIPRRGYRFIAEVRESATVGVAASRKGDNSHPADADATAEMDTLKAGEVFENVTARPTSSAESDLTAPTVSTISTAPVALTVSTVSSTSTVATSPSVSSSSSRRTRFRAGMALTAALMLCALVGAALYWRLSAGTARPAKASVAAVRSIAVLPFKSLGADADEAYLGPGMADALVTKLSGAGQVSVAPTSAVLRYGGAEQDPLAAGRELGVDAVLDGKVQRAGEQVRVTVQLVRVRDGEPLWAEKFDEHFSDIFRIQDAISEHVAGALTLRLNGDAETRSRKHYTENAEAYQSYLKGRYFWNKRTPAGLRKGIDYFRQAIVRDPNYALAYAGLADCYIRLGEPGQPAERDDVAEGTDAVRRALELDDTLAEAHATAAFIKFRFDWDFDASEREYRRALELDPNYSEAHQWYAFHLLASSRRAEADAEIKRALELDPVSLSHNEALSLYLFFTRQYDEGIAQCLKTLEMEPKFAPAHYVLAMNYEQKGRYTEAASELQKTVGDSGQGTGMVAALAHVLAASGRKEEARKLLADLQARSAQGNVPPNDVALVFAGLGEKERALDWYERAAASHSLRPAWLLLDPRLDGLRESPRFAALLRRVGAAR